MAKEFEGYLVKFDVVDTDGERFTKRTDFHLQDFPIKGAPILFQHGFDGIFEGLGIGKIAEMTEDEIGIHVKLMTNEREHYEKVIRDRFSRHNKSITDEQVIELADKVCKFADTTVEQVVKLGGGLSLGSTQRLWRVAPDGEILSSPVIEGTLTHTPAEPYETVVDYVKTLTEVLPSEDSGHESGKGNSKLKNNLVYKAVKFENRSGITMNEETIKLIHQLSDSLRASAQKEVDENVEGGIDEEVLLESISEAAKSKVLADTGVKAAIEAGDKIEEAVEAAFKNYKDDVLEGAIISVLESRKADEDATKSVVAGALSKANIATSKTSGFGQTPNETKAQIEVTRNEEPSISSFIKSFVKGTEEYRGGQDKAFKDAGVNPYVGPLGGVLVGQQMSQNVLEPLRPEVVTFKAGIKQTSVSSVGSYTVARMNDYPTGFRPGLNEPIAESGAAFDTITAFLRPLAARVVIPRQMLLVTGHNIEAYIREQLIKSLALQIDREILEGTGSVTGSNTGQEIKGIYQHLQTETLTNPEHVLTLAANGRKPVFDDFINAETAVDLENVPAGNRSFIMHPRDRGTIRRMTDANGQPLMYNTFSDSAREQLIGYDVHTTTQLDTTLQQGTSSDCSRIFYGDWGYGEYVMGNNLEFIVDEVSLSNKLQVAITAYMYSDFIVHRPEAFAVLNGVRAV